MAWKISSSYPSGPQQIGPSQNRAIPSAPYGGAATQTRSVNYNSAPAEPTKAITSLQPKPATRAIQNRFPTGPPPDNSIMQADLGKGTQVESGTSMSFRNVGSTTMAFQNMNPLNDWGKAIQTRADTVSLLGNSLFPMKTFSGLEDIEGGEDGGISDQY